MSGFIRSFGHAIRGVGVVVKKERNARIHLAATVAVVIAGFLFDLSAGEFAAVIFAIALVFFAEVVNSAIEKTLDLVEPNTNPIVRDIKDIAAGGVLVSAIAALIIGVLVFTK